MSANPDDYPVTTHLAWGGLERYLFMGPFMGALAGFAQFMASVTIAAMAKDVDAAFRGMQGVVVAFLMSIALCGVLGCASGMALLGFEKISDRRVRPIISWPLVMLPVYLIMLGAMKIDVQSAIKGPAMCVAIMMGPFVFGVIGGVLSSAKPLSFLDNR